MPWLQHPAILTPCGAAAGDRICTTPVNENWIMEFHVCHDQHQISTTRFLIQAVNPVRELFCFCILAKLRSTRDVLPRLCLTHHCARLCRTQHPTRSCFSGFGPGDSEGCLSCWLHTVAWRKVNDIRPHLGDDC